jgi:hypothetical protein
MADAIGPLASRYLERFGFAVPFLAAGVLATLALVVVGTQVAETGDPDVSVGVPWSESGNHRNCGDSSGWNCLHT